MAAWRRRGGLEPFREKLVRGMRERGYDEEFAERIYRQILGFGEYGFPESHAASFALLVYVSAWMKCHHPAAFACAVLNSQPMGFYAPAQLVQDAVRHGVEVRPVDINASEWDCTLEPAGSGPALRLGLRLVRHLSQDGANRLVKARGPGAYRNTHDLAYRSQLDRGDLNALARAGALDGISRHRHRAAWDLGAVTPELAMLHNAWPAEPAPLLRAPGAGETVRADYSSLGLTLGPHPLALLRRVLDRRHIRRAEHISRAPHGSRVRVAGIVTCRQRPSSANNVAFVTLEDETGYVNLVVWKHIAERDRRVLTTARLMAAYGEVQREGDVIHVIVRQLRDFSDLLGELLTRSRDFR
jgi:error-prone DNA polymerase